jgi:hypothetical protein
MRTAMIAITTSSSMSVKPRRMREGIPRTPELKREGWGELRFSDPNFDGISKTPRKPLLAL